MYVYAWECGFGLTYLAVPHYLWVYMAVLAV